MFTGIIQQTCTVAAVAHKSDFMTFAVALPQQLCDGLVTGASVAINGCCQTVRRIDATGVWFDAMQETLDKTTLGSLQEGEAVNVERAAKFGDEIGGHELSGHVDGVLEIRHILKTEDNFVLSLALPEQFTAYVFNKGYLAVHGASLTVSDYDVKTGIFKVYLIPETLRVTNLEQYRVGDRLNLEIERKTQVIVDTVNAYLGSKQEL